MPIVCDVCGSDEIATQNEGFNFTKAVIGDVLSGPVLGVYLGGRNQHTIILTCLNCGNKWKPKDRYKHQNRSHGSDGSGILSGLGILILWLGIFLMPYLFSWFTLRKSHSTGARVVAFGWLLTCVALITVVTIQGPGDQSATQTVVKPTSHQQADIAPAVIARANSVTKPSPLPSPITNGNQEVFAPPTNHGVSDVARPSSPSPAGVVDEPNYSPTFRDCLAKPPGGGFITMCVKPELKDQSLKLRLQYEQLLSSLDFGHQMHLRTDERQWEDTLRSRCGLQQSGSDIEIITDDQAACELPAVAQRRLDLQKVDQ